MSKKRLSQKAGYMETCDVRMAAVLIIEGYPILEHRKVEFGRDAFTFIYDDDIKEIRELYEREQLEIEPKLFYATLQDVYDRAKGVKNDN